MSFLSASNFSKRRQLLYKENCYKRKEKTAIADCLIPNLVTFLKKTFFKRSFLSM